MPQDQPVAGTSQLSTCDPIQVTPASASERIGAIDVMRGAAILGILPMNIQLFAMIDGAFLNPMAGQWTDPLNVAVWTFLHIFVGHRDLTIFSMLFGAGILMIETRRRSAGRGAKELHYRRMLILAVIGLIHAYVIWSGDILFTYAICGFIVHLFCHMRPAILISLGVLAYAVPMLLLLGAHLVVPSLPSDNLAELHTMFQPTPEMIAEHNQIYAGGWLDQMGSRAASAIGLQTVFLVGALGWVAGGMMLVGMGLHKLGVFTATLRDRVYWWMVAGGAFVGLPIILFGLQRNFAADWQPAYSFLGGRLPSECVMPIMALAWIGVIMLVCKHNRLGWLTGPASAVGRMALTNYLMATVVFSLGFYGHGLGLVGRIDRLGQLLMAVALGLFQLVMSPLWLKHYRFGPFEWLWRTLIYGKLPAMRIAP